MRCSKNTAWASPVISRASSRTGRPCGVPALYGGAYSEGNTRGTAASWKNGYAFSGGAAPGLPPDLAGVFFAGRAKPRLWRRRDRGGEANLLARLAGGPVYGARPAGRKRAHAGGEKEFAARAKEPQSGRR